MRNSEPPRVQVSAVIPVYNGERYLREAIESVLAQDYPDLELIIIDDGSTDCSAGIARSYIGKTDHALRYHRQDNAGLSAAQNAGVHQASGAFIAFLDCDDVWLPGKISLQMKAFASEPELGMVFGQVQQFRSPELSCNAAPETHIEAQILAGYSTGTMLARSGVFKQVGLFSTDYRLGEFLDWYSRASDAGLQSKMLDVVLLRRRIHRDNMGVRERDKRADYLRVFKASLDRRRQADRHNKENPAT